MEQQMKYALGVDIGGSHITAAVVDMEGRSILKDSYRRSRVDSRSSAENIIDQWCATIVEAIDSGGREVNDIGIAMPGPFDYAEGISYIKQQDKYDSLYGLNVKGLLTMALSGPSTIRFENDAACFLKGEMFAGAARSVENVLGFTLGTGLGSAVAVDGNAKDAELWNSPFKEGIAEDYLSTRWFLKRYHELSGLHIENVKQLCLSEHRDLSREIFDEFGGNLRLFISQQIKVHHPEVIVIGGNIALAFDQFHHHLADFNISTNKAVLGEEAALLGAAGSLVETVGI